MGSYLEGYELEEGSSSYKFFEWRKCVNAVRFIGRVKRMVERSKSRVESRVVSGQN